MSFRKVIGVRAALAAPASIDWRGWLFALGMALAVPAAADVFNREDVVLDPVPSHFSVCFNGSCKDLSVVGLDVEQWRQVKEQFNPPAPDTETERKQIASAIALMERFVGTLTGTDHDLGRNDTGISGGGHRWIHRCSPSN